MEREEGRMERGDEWTQTRSTIKESTVQHFHVTGSAAPVCRCCLKIRFVARSTISVTAMWCT